MPMYPDHLPLGANLKDNHAQSLEDIAGPGEFFTGSERLEIVRIARAALDCEFCAERKASLSPNSVQGLHNVDSDFPDVVVDMIHRIRTDPGRLTRSWFDQVTAEITPAQYVEIVSVVASSVIIDTLHNALGLGVPHLPQPRPGRPQRRINEAVEDAGAWVPILQAPDQMADTGLPVVPNIARSLGLVESALGLFFQTFRPHYALKDIPLSISQAQAEFVAARVSALNECFY